MENEFGQIAALIGDPVRSKILWALLDGRAYTATELAVYTDTSAQNISMHLSKLVKAELLGVEVQGRHRYYNYARPEIAFAIEAMANLIPKDTTTSTSAQSDKPVKYCRTCYDHLAGRVSVLLTENLVSNGIIHKHENNFDITSKGTEWFNGFGIDVCLLKQQKRSFARSCLDWSERRHHLAGALGAALLNTMILQGWIRRMNNSRVINITTKGREAFYDHFRLDIY